MRQALENVLVRMIKDAMSGKLKAELVKCKYCESSDIWRYGLNRNGIQRYYCPNCDKVFLDNDALPRMSISVKQLGDILGQYYGGMSLKELRRQFEQQHNGTLARSSFDRWLERFSKIAVDEANKCHPKVGDTWIADETVLKIGGNNVWCWDIIDSDTRFLLATHLSKTRTTQDAQALMEKAKSVADKIPKVVITDYLNAYIDGIELTWGSETRHIQSKPFAEADISTNKIERFHSTLKARTTIMRGLKSLETAQALLDGWLVHYNYFRTHEGLDDKTPAEEAQTKFPFKDWLEVIESQRLKIELDIPKHGSIADDNARMIQLQQDAEYYEHPTYKKRLKHKLKRASKSNQSISVLRGKR